MTTLKSTNIDDSAPQNALKLGNSTIPKTLCKYYGLLTLSSHATEPGILVDWKYMYYFCMYFPGVLLVAKGFPRCFPSFADSLFGLCCKLIIADNCGFHMYTLLLGLTGSWLERSISYWSRERGTPCEVSYSSTHSHTEGLIFEIWFPWPLLPIVLGMHCITSQCKGAVEAGYRNCILRDQMKSALICLLAIKMYISHIFSGFLPKSSQKAFCSKKFRSKDLFCPGAPAFCSRF